MNNFKGFTELIELQKYFQIKLQDKNIDFEDKIYKIPEYRYPESKKDFDLIIDTKFKEYKEKFPVCEFPEFASYTVKQIENLLLVIENELSLNSYHEHDIYNIAKAYLSYINEKHIPKPKKEYSINEAIGICLRMAFENNKITEQIFHSIQLYEYAKKKFNLKNGKRAGDIAKQAHNLKQKQIQRPKEYQYALKLYSEKFEND